MATGALARRFVRCDATLWRTDRQSGQQCHELRGLKRAWRVPSPLCRRFSAPEVANRPYPSLPAPDCSNAILAPQTQLVCKLTRIENHRPRDPR